jgi:hypothetical protein
MDFNATVDLIIKELNEARDIIDDLKNYPDVPALQVELAKAKCKNAAEVIALLKNLKEKGAVEKRDPITPGPVKKEAAVIRMHESPKPEEVEHKAEVRQTPSIDTKSRPGRTSKKTSESVIVADTFSQMQSSLNEQLGSRKEEDDVTDLIKTKPITNLSEAIGVNDKFLFIRELFNGNSESYEKAISSLDRSSSFADARAVIMSYAGNNMETEAVKQLLDLVKRKFPADE